MIRPVITKPKINNHNLFIRLQMCPIRVERFGKKTVKNIK